MPLILYSLNTPNVHFHQLVVFPEGSFAVITVATSHYGKEGFEEYGNLNGTVTGKDFNLGILYFLVGIEDHR